MARPAPRPPAVRCGANPDLAGTARSLAARLRPRPPRWRDRTPHEQTKPRSARPARTRSPRSR
eukprot:4605691-Prymnesium_polylepis.1